MLTKSDKINKHISYKNFLSNFIKTSNLIKHFYNKIYYLFLI